MIWNCDLPTGFEDGALGAILTAVAWVVSYFITRKKQPQ
jgi:hypothetical protein